MAFSLSMNTPTLRPTLTFPGLALPKVSRVSGFSTTTRVQLKTRRSGRISLIVAQSSSDDGPASVKVKYDNLLKEMEPIPGDYVKAVMKRVNKYKRYVAAKGKSKLAWNSVAHKAPEVLELQILVQTILAYTFQRSEDVETLESLMMKQNVMTKYDEALNELVTLAKNFIKAEIRRAMMWNNYATALKDAKSSWLGWVNKTKEVTELQSQLGTSVEKSSPSSDNDEFASLKVKYDKVFMELKPAKKKYTEAKMKRIMKEYPDESEEEMLAWESWEKTRLEVLELQMKMYILRPGIEFELRKWD